METKYVFFFRENDINGYCSQWCLSPFITLDGKKFTNAEQYMMYRKALLFGDNLIADKIIKAYNPRDIKQLGRIVKNFNDDVWNKHKCTIVFEGNCMKFLQNPNIRSKLLSSYENGNAHFVEASPYDAVWGIGMAKSTALRHRIRWGTNYLGKILDKVAQSILQHERSLVKQVINSQIEQYLSEANIQKHEKKKIENRVKPVENVKVLINNADIDLEPNMDIPLNIEINSLFAPYAKMYVHITE